MGSFIVRLEGKYFDWSTVVDAPVSDPMTLDEYKAQYRERFGSSGMSELPKRLARIEETGFSCRDRSYDLESLLLLNRAGPNEKPLTEAGLRAWARGEPFLPEHIDTTERQ